MKPLCKTSAIALAAITLHLSPFTFHLNASVPLAWDVRPGQPAPVMFDRYHGETLSFSATFRGFGELPFSPGADIRLWYQTNGMGRAWWSVPATVSSNVLSATWSPALDPGADRVSLFFGAPSNAYAAAVLRLRHSPGFAPGAMPAPESFHESDPVFAEWLATGTVARALAYGTPTRWTDATGCVWEVNVSVATNYYNESYGVLQLDGWHEIDGAVRGASWSNGDVTLFWMAGSWNYTTLTSHSEGVTGTPYDSIVTFDDLVFTRQLTTNTVPHVVGRVALTNDLPDTASIESNIADLRTESALVYRLYSGSNVVAEVTNYNSQVHAPELRLMQLNESNEYITVWTETNGLARTLASASAYTDNATNALSKVYAPRAWSRTTSGLGAEAPSNTTWISTPTTVIAGGFEYTKFVDTYGEVWVLTSNGMAAEFNPDTNAYFRISADDGTPIFSIEKSDAQLVGANASGITFSNSSITIPVPVVSSTAPTMYWRYALDSGDWADETTPPSNMGVMWEGGAGTWQCNITFDGTRPPLMFFKFNFLQEGGVMIRNNATTDLSSGIWVNGIKYVPVVNGSTLTWQAQ